MEEKKVSIIVPIYNDKENIERCIESILCQTYQNFEIFLVDDGSFDGSKMVCRKYAEQDKRIQYYQLKHIGVAAARNYALKRVTGQYVQFVDSDDYLKNTATETLVSCMTDYNMAVAGYYRLLKEGTLTNPHLEREGIYSSKEYLVHTLKDPGHHYYGVNWNKMYSTKLLQDNAIHFDECVTLGEDFIFNLAYMKVCSQVKVTYDPIYYYNCIRQDSLSREQDKTIESCEKELENRLIIYQYYESCFEYFGMKEKYLKEMQLYWVMFYIRQNFHLLFEFRKWSGEDRKRWRKRIQNQLVIVESIHNNNSRYWRIKILTYLRMETKRLTKQCIRIIKKGL